MKTTHALLILLALAVALVAMAQLPTASGHATRANDRHHDHHDHHDRDHCHGHSHGHSHDDHSHAHDDHDDHKHDDAHAHARHDHHAHAHHDHAHAQDATAATAATAATPIDRFSARVWAEALFATALVGAAPVVVLFFVPLGRSGSGSADAQKPLLRVFLSFAAGGLLGDALLHLLPHSLPSGGHHDHDHHGHHDHDHHGHDHGHEGHAHSVQDLAVWLYCIAGMMSFLMLEKFVRAQTGGGDGGHGHSHGHAAAPLATATATAAPAADGLRKRAIAGKKAKTSDDEGAKNQTTTTSHEPTRIAAAGYLNLAADFSHNFTDGLAIGATFLRGSGWQTTVAMLLHEVPHEIGDFAILIQSGFTRRQAMLTQLGTALGAMAGTVLGLLLEGAGDAGSAWISPFTAGGFIYIACASVMPELLEDCSLAQSVKEGVAMCLGISLMIVIALYE